jgi:hypothetical protein
MSNPKNWKMVYDFRDSKPDDVMQANVRIYRNTVTGAEVRIVQSYNTASESIYIVESRRIDADEPLNEEETNKNKAITIANEWMYDYPLAGGRVTDEIERVYRAENESDAVFGVKKTGRFSSNDYIVVAASSKLGGYDTQHLLIEAVEIVNEVGNQDINIGVVRREDYRILPANRIKSAKTGSVQINFDEREVIY